MTLRPWDIHQTARPGWRRRFRQFLRGRRRVRSERWFGSSRTTSFRRWLGLGGSLGFSRWFGFGRRLGGSSPGGWRLALIGIGAVAVVAAAWISWPSNLPDQGSQTRPPNLTALPSAVLTQSLDDETEPFAELLASTIRRQGCLSVTVHVALADFRHGGVPKKFGRPDDCETNLYWGALYGVDTHLANAAAWRRVYSDEGDGINVVQRSVFRRHADPSEAWRDRGASEGFDVFVLANAWRGSRVTAAMEQPFRDALSADPPTRITVGGREIAFGSGSVLTGYLGRNGMLETFWDPCAALPARCVGRQVGMFYICPRSAPLLHAPVAEHGLYPVLFAREPIVPEAYLLDGMLQALIAGDLDDGFTIAAAAQYARYQKGLSQERAAAMLFR